MSLKTSDTQAHVSILKFAFPSAVVIYKHFILCNQTGRKSNAFTGKMKNLLFYFPQNAVYFIAVCFYVQIMYIFILCIVRRILNALQVLWGHTEKLINWTANGGFKSWSPRWHVSIENSSFSSFPAPFISKEYIFLLMIEQEVKKLNAW